tara:strand:- start:94 stop:828 length:735 start_codon:yes stop_codon:yes gene_type:complete
VIRFIQAWLAFLLTASSATLIFGQESAQQKLSFSLYVWPWEKTTKSQQPSIGKNDPVRYAAEVRYRDGNETHAVNLLPGRQSKRLFYGGQGPLVLDRFIAESNSTRGFATLPLEPRWRDVLFILYYPKGNRTYENLSIDRTSVTRSEGGGIVFNLSQKRTRVQVNGITKSLQHKQKEIFLMRRAGQDFTRFQISVEPQESDDEWIVAHSSKRYLSKRAGTVFLLSPFSGNSGSRLKMVTLSPPR